MLAGGTYAQSSRFIYKKQEIGGSISPKSIVSNGNGIFAAQNMMYRHTVTLYDKSGNLLARIPDAVDLNRFGHSEYGAGSYLGGPVEAAFSKNGRYLWVSNYNMIGKGFDNPGCDGCSGKGFDPGFVYKINTATYVIENVIRVGAVPKYLAISPDEKRMIVSNWSSSDISVVDLVTEQEIKRVDVGAHPRGIAISSDGLKAYVTVMGSTRIAVVDLESYAVTNIEGIGRSPRHVLLSANDSLLYVSLNSSNALLRYELSTGRKQTCVTNPGPRSMILSPDQRYLYVVNYFSNTFSKVRTDSMTVVEVVNTGHHPIGITANWEDAEIWVACYEGKIEIFKDFDLAASSAPESFLFEEELAAFLELFTPVYPTGETTLVGSVTTPGPSEDDERITVDTAVGVSVVNAAAVVKPKANRAPLTRLDPSRMSTGLAGNNDQTCIYHVIVGSFSIPENADRFRLTVEEKGYPARVIPSGGGLTYVSAQCFPSRESADLAIDRISADMDVSAWILGQ